MMGALAGDMAGSIYEWHNIKTKDFPLLSDRCFFTDDSILTVALADTILTGTPYVENLWRFYRWYPHGGYGGSLHAWAQREDPQPYNSWGNGAIFYSIPEAIQHQVYALLDTHLGGITRCFMERFCAHP